MAHRHRAQGGAARASGGRTDMGKGRMSYVGKTNVEPEAADKKDTFKRGGHKGLHAHGHKSKHRADKRARGGGVGKGNFPIHTTHSPFSSAARGNDEKRRPKDKDNHQPRATGGAAFAHGGRTKVHAGIGGKGKGGSRPHMGAKHKYNFGHHDGSGHEESLQRSHPPVHHKHGGPEHGHKRAAGGAVALARGGHAHHAGHGAHHAHHPHHDGHHHGHHDMHGSHKAKGHKHRGRAEGGKVDKEDD